MGCCLGEDANLAAAPLAQSLFFRPRERRPPMGRRRHTMAVEALVSPRATRLSSRRSSRRSSQRNSVHKWQKTVSRGHSRRLVYTVASPRPARTILASQQCTQMPQNGAKRPFSPICVHSLPPGASRPCGIRVDAHPHDRLVRLRPNRPRMGEVTRLTQRTDYLCAKTHTPAQARPERHEQRGDGGNPRPQGHLKEVRQSNRRKVVR